jgi:signal transduction histidine kinase
LSRNRGLASVGEFAASLAHEVRNPLTAIRIELQSVEEETTSPQARAGLARALWPCNAWRPRLRVRSRGNTR